MNEIKKGHGIVTVDENRCKGCGLCVTVCPKHIMQLDRSKLNAKGYNPSTCVDPSACIACTFCGIICPDSAITIEKE